MSRTLALFAVGAGVIALSGCQAQSDQAFGERVRAYLLAHPEVLAEASQKLQTDEDAQAVAAMTKAEARLPTLRSAIERDPRDFVANPNGKITVTEFYDYRCPHCEAMAPRLLALIKTNSDIRFVFKEMPIFGATSEHAAYAAIAVKKDGGNFLGLYRGFMTTEPLTDQAIDKIATANGARTSDMAPDSANTAQLATTKDLFDKLGLDGTPGFVVGDQILAGDDMQALTAAIDKARKNGAS